MNGHLKFTYKVPNQTTPNQITLNRTMWSQTRPASPIHVWPVLFWGITQHVLRQPISRSFKGQEIQTREHRMTEVNCHNLSGGGTWQSPNFLKLRNILEAGSDSFSGKNMYPGGPLRLSYSPSLGTTETVIVNIRTWAQI